MSKKVVIIGAGISGLTTAYFLAKNGFDVTVLEKKKDVGGSIETVKEKGFLFDRRSDFELTYKFCHSVLSKQNQLHDLP